MSFDFPSPASEGQFYTPLNGPQYVYVNGAWRMAGAPTAVVTAETRNRIVNGAMQISQENVNTAGTTNVYYAVDQFFMGFVHGGVMTAQRVQSITPNGSLNRFRMTVSTADATLAAGDFLNIVQNIEGQKVVDFKWSVAGAKQVILRFGWKSPAGTYSVALSNGTSANRSYIVNFTISAGQANTDTEQVFVIPGDVTGVWSGSELNGLQIRFVMAAGTTYQGVAGWQAGLLFGTAFNSNGMATAGNVFELYDVGLYCDPLATGIAPPWQMPDEAEELRACQRYYVTSLYNIYSSNVTSGNTYYLTTPLPVQPRTAPTLSGVHSIVSGFPGVIGTLVYIYNGIRENRSSNVTVNAGYFAQTYTANARM